MEVQGFTAERTVAEIVAAHPRTSGVFSRLGVDACCGGRATLAEAAAESGVALETLLAELARESGVSPAGASGAPDAVAAPLRAEPAAGTACGGQHTATGAKPVGEAGAAGIVGLKVGGLSQRPAGLPDWVDARTSIRTLIARMPGAAAALDLHGLGGCGGPEGPEEPLDVFATAHRVELRILLEDLARVARGEPLGAVVPGPQAIPAVPQLNVYRPFLVSSLVGATAFGVALGAVAAVFHHIGVAVPVGLVQAHGHFQLFFVVGLFILGVAFHVLPRMRGGQLELRPLARASLPLLAAGVVLRDVPLAHGASGLVVSACAGLAALLVPAGALAGAAALVATLRRGSGEHEPFERVAALAAVGLVAAAGLDAVASVQVALAGVASVPAPLAGGVAALALQGFVLVFCFAISMRTFPAFLGVPPPRTELAVAASVQVALGAVAEAASLSAPTWFRGVPTQLAPAAGIVVGFGALLFVVALRPFSPMPGAALAGQELWTRRFARTAFGWLVLAAVLRIGLGAWQLGGGAPSGAWLDAARHLLALGFVLHLIAGMAFRILPIFEGASLAMPGGRPVVLALLSGSMVLRLAQIPAAEGWAPGHALAAASGPLALVGVALLAGMLLVTMFGRRLAAPARPRTAGPLVIDEQVNVGELIDAVPGALEALVAAGFTPLKNPIARRAMAPRITLGLACSLKSVELQPLLATLRALQGGATAGRAGASTVAGRPTATAADAQSV